ncbi:MAG: TolC family protein, partial [Bdellovibrionales bacterium]|nr:TolC family protein [Bdellovibrionales bacterium]
INQILESRREVKNIKILRKTGEALKEKSFEGLDWNFTSSVGYEDSEEVNLQAFKNEKDETLTYSLGMDKMFSSATTLSIKFDRQSRDSELNPLISTNNPTFGNARTADKLTVNISQELWRNAFGANTRRKLNSGSLEERKANFNSLEKLEDLTLEALKLYWDTFVAKESLKASLEAQKRFEKLTKTIGSKAKLGYSNPGELNIPLAELEEKKQQVKIDSAKYLEKSRELFRMLQQPMPNELNFTASTALAEPNNLPDYKIDELRKIEILNMDLVITENKLKNKVSENQPQLQFVASAAYSGADTKPGEAWSEALSGDKPIYAVGLNLNLPLYSKFNRGSIKELNYNLEKNKIELNIEKEKLQNEINNLQDTVNANYLIAQSYSKSYVYRKDAAVEIEKAFRQGRSDISILVQTYNALSMTETQKIKSIGDYHIALNQLAATLDLLIKSEPTAKGEL